MVTPELLQRFFDSKERVAVIEDFTQSEDEFVGRLKIDTAKGAVEFLVEIPDSFPFHSTRKSIAFFCQDGDGYSHLNADGSICILPRQMTDVAEKLEEEFSLLMEWIEKYYVSEEKDIRYEYPVIHLPRVDIRERLLYTDVERAFRPGEFGEFNYTRINGMPAAVKSADDLYVTSISDAKSAWASSIHTLPQEIGVWVYIDQEPFVYRSKMAGTWRELSRFLPQAFMQELAHRKEVFRHGQGLGAMEFLFVMIGYQIPGSNNEVHWLLAKVPMINIPISGQHIGPEFIGEYTDQEIVWCYTSNASYKRFFGRGGFSPTLTGSRILILGAGSIGSSLAVTLTRGGARDITVVDGQTVEPGNICRSTYTCSNNHTLKCLALVHQLFKISPYVEVGCHVKDKGSAIVLSKSLTPEWIQITRERLEPFDWIFDCTADDELCYALDKIHPRGIMLNLSVTDEAKEFVCVTGNEIYRQKEILFGRFNQNDADYYEGTGCWNPTFRASYFDINAGLQLALKNIDAKVKNGMMQRTFFIRSEENDGSYNMMTYDC